MNQTWGECPKCTIAKTNVVCTKRAPDGVIVRRRKCNACDHRWYTVQYPEIAVSNAEIRWVKTETTAKFVPSA